MPNDVLGAFNAASAAVSALIQIVKTANNVEANNNLLEIQNHLLLIQQGSLSNINRIAELEQELRELRFSLKTDQELEKIGDTFWRKTEAGWKGPYCPVCWGTTSKLVSLVSTVEDGAATYHYWMCQVHTVGSFSVRTDELRRMGILDQP